MSGQETKSVVEQLMAEVVEIGANFSLRTDRGAVVGSVTYQAYVWKDDPEHAQLDFARTPDEALSEALRRYQLRGERSR